MLSGSKQGRHGLRLFTLYKKKPALMRVFFLVPLLSVYTARLSGLQQFAQQLDMVTQRLLQGAFVGCVEGH